MKKLKYLLFVIPFLFIFIGNIFALDGFSLFKDLSIGDNIGGQTLKVDTTGFVSSDFAENYDGDVYMISFFGTQDESSNGALEFTSGLILSDISNSINVYNPDGTSFGNIDISHYYLWVVSIDIVNGEEQYNGVYVLEDYTSLTNYGDYIIPDDFLLGMLDFESFSSSYNVWNTIYIGENSITPPIPEEPTIENKIYLPIELQTGNCPIILNQNVIRVYEEEPILNTPVNYTDYFINSHYISQTGIDNLSNSISCMDLDKFTTNYVYRFDFHQIIIIFLSIVIILAYPFMKIIHAFFIGFKRR